MAEQVHESGYKIGDEVTLGVLPGDTQLNAVVDGFYGHFVIISFDKDGLYLSRYDRSEIVSVKTNEANWYHSMMIVHPDNLTYRDKSRPQIPHMGG